MYYHGADQFHRLNAIPKHSLKTIFLRYTLYYIDFPTIYGASITATQVI